MRRHIDFVLFGLLILSLSGNVYQDRYRRSPATPSLRVLHAGDHVPALHGTALDGATITLDFQSRPTVMYVFRPSCLWCERNIDNAKALAIAAKSQFDFVAVATSEEGLDDYVRTHKLDWQIVRNTTPDTREAFKLGPTPVTLVIGIGGVIVQAWPGAYGKTTSQDIEAQFGIHLPGLRAGAN